MSCPNTLEQAIIRTVSWFSLFEYPLTSFEVWKYLFGKKATLQEVDLCLYHSDYLQKHLEKKDGFIFFYNPTRSIEDILRKHHENYVDAIFKLKKIKRMLWFFRLFPSIECVAACNSLAWFSTTHKSDIDLFIIVKPGTIWITRLCLVIPFVFLGKRPGQTIKDPFCFSFFLSSDNLNLEQFAIKPKDFYLALWAMSLIPFLNRGRTFEIFIERNQWVFSDFPNNVFRQPHEELCQNIKKRICIGFSWIERFARFIQWKRFPSTLKNIANKNTNVVISDQVLKFHIDDKRQFFYEQWKKRIAIIICVFFLIV